MHLDLFLYLSVCLASARLVLLELKEKNDLRRSAASIRFLVSLQADEELEPVGKAVWTVCARIAPHHRSHGDRTAAPSKTKKKVP